MNANTDTLTNAVALLRQYNAWRRDGEGVLTMPKPTEIGIALDTVLDAVGELAALRVMQVTLKHHHMTKPGIARLVQDTQDAIDAAKGGSHE